MVGSLAIKARDGLIVKQVSPVVDQVPKTSVVIPLVVQPSLCVHLKVYAQRSLLNK